ncbi:uncharacterized protein LOC118736350 [Rhagoletis pomonella]|uniref:uncharacterized protein LOC118736350 n=1 Tax=Rhagoletis pomonella TaxID=28610 RepID=UPI0017846C00|nr:uncharacterized protein LOC118736350 [Rhagoletis pomonella]
MKIELMRLEEQKETELKYLRQKYEIMRKYESSDESDDENLEALKVHRTLQWANGNGQGGMGGPKERQLETGVGHEGKELGSMSTRTKSARLVGTSPHKSTPQLKPCKAESPPSPAWLSRLENKIESIVEQITTRMKEVEERVMQRIGEITADLANVKLSMSSFERLKEELAEQENGSVAADVILNGIPREKDENTVEIVKKVCKALNVDAVSVRAAFRVRTNNAKTAPLIAKLASSNDRALLLKAAVSFYKTNKRGLQLRDIGSVSEERVFLNECLTKSARCKISYTICYAKQIQARTTSEANAIGLTAQQISSRHVVPKDLPTFSGRPEEWALFISSFENSTRLCGFSHDENLLRLQRALKGRALEYVSSKLMIPALVPEIISTLRMNLAAAMEASGLQSHMTNPLLIQELVEKLPAQMRLQWAMFSRPAGDTTIKGFSEWLFDLADACKVTSIISTASPESERRKTHRVSFHTEEVEHSDGYVQQVRPKLACYFCNESHVILKCDKFRELGYDEKWNEVHKLKLCRICLKKHDARSCRDSKVCGVDNCAYRHNPVLHKPMTGENVDGSTTVGAHQVESSNTLYRVVPITIYGNGISCDVFAFLDDGSGPTLIEKNVLQQLKVQGDKTDLCLRWTDGTVRVEKNSDMIDLEISTRGKGKKHMLRNVRSVEAIDLPAQTMNIAELAEEYRHLRGIPVESYYNVVPQVIIGLSNKNLMMPLKFREGKAHEPAATKTRIGWTVYGVMNSDAQKITITCNFIFYDDSKHNKFCDRQQEGMHESVSRDGKHFVTKLLWKSESINMPDNYVMALRRLRCFERKLNGSPELKSFVSEHICSMQEKGYIRKLNANEVVAPHPRKWYLPMFVVQNPNKPRKVRVVWDAAAEYKGVSLNSLLNKGPDLLTSLFDVLLNFRSGKIGISGDISEMFHRIFVDEEDQQSQRFLWRNCDETRPPDVYLLRVMSFGASCSPSLAQFVKNQNAKEFADTYPRPAKSILERHYVDDMLDSVNTVQEAIELARGVRDIHKQANFHIRGWLSNSKEVTEALGEAGDADEFCSSAKRVDQVVEASKVLGMWWQTTDDTFTYNLKFTKANDEILRGARLPTKRELLRLLMSIFDPLGLLTFFLIDTKILLQKVWRSGVGWDDIIPEEFSAEWMRWLSFLPQVQSIKIPRCYFSMMCSEEAKCELHLFVDAGENAYAAVAYLRTKNGSHIGVSLVCAKSKVAPLRPVSISRMELLAAVMGARLGNSVVKALDFKIGRVCYWTDSGTVLSWLRSDPTRYKQFVMFRVGEIQETTDIAEWKYVPSKLNVADLGTKQISTPDFSTSGQWISGPTFLRQQEENWPNLQCKPEGNKQREERPQLVAVNIQNEPPLIDLTRFSKWERLFGCTAYVKRFVSRLRGIPSEGAFTIEELAWSEAFLYRLAQAQDFPNEIKMLSQNPVCAMPKTSPLRKLSPFIDETMTLRMRGRLENANCIDNAMKNPIILPRYGYITRLIIDWYHRRWKHSNHETVINEIFQQFYVPGLRTLLRSVRKCCQFCKNATAHPQPPEMADLPEARLSPYTRPFTYVGVDFFGPFLTTVGRRIEKRYGVVFTCMTCRAVHVEMAYSLTTSSCCIVVRNFIARRGTPRKFFSDNGTNLRATEKELRESLSQVNFADLEAEFTSPSTGWTFIPPASPHMGGAWERLVRSIKAVLYQIITPETKLTDEKLHNLFLEVEQIVNSRPLTYLSLDTAEQEALTPNHFLLCSSTGLKPVGRFEATDQYVEEKRAIEKTKCEYLNTIL